MPIHAAIFDVDRTITDGMTGYTFSRYLFKHADLPISSRLRVARDVFLYKTKLASEKIIVEIGVTIYARKRVEDLRRFADKCVQEEVKGHCYQEALERIDKHKENGDHVLLASGSSDFIIDALAKQVGAHGSIATSAQVKDGRSTKRIIYPLCYQEGKLTLIKKYLKPLGIDLKTATVYTDNIADLPLLECVKRPVVVNPLTELAQIAKARGWEIEHWQTPTDPTLSFTGSSFPLREH